MGEKWFRDFSKSAEKLFQDVGTNNVRVYEVPDYQQATQIPVHPSGLTEKWSQVVVATSGDGSAGRDWMVVAPYRVDHTKDPIKKCIDVDPVLFVFDRDATAPHPSGVVAYHQEFHGRTSTIEDSQPQNLDDAVARLRTKVLSGVSPLQTAPPQVLEALQHMVDKYGLNFV